MPSSRLPLLVLLLAMAACGGEREPTEAEREARRAARRDACIAEALQERARQRLATLDTLLEESRTRGAAPAVLTAPHTFAQVYATVADLRAHEAAYIDSAYSAPSREDSLRFDGLAASFRVGRPTPESLEANVRRDYARDFAASRADPEHVCNHLVADGSRAGTPRN
jgi:hypothetical protein